MFDWHRFHASEHRLPAVVDPRRRLWIAYALFVGLLLVVFGRILQLEISQGEAFRAEAARPLRKETRLPGVRGRILAGDGAVLAYDKKSLHVAVHYRYLEEPPDTQWLRRTARRRLTVAERKNPQQVEAEQARLVVERRELARRLANLCGVSLSQWDRRAGRIQRQVERIAASVSQRRGAKTTVAEELDYHMIVDDVPLEVVAQIEGHPDDFPGVKIIQHSCRAYPSAALASHVLGHLGPVESAEIDQNDPASHLPDDYVGRMGLERQYEKLLHGAPGLLVEMTNHGGEVLSSYREREPGVGRDLILTLDSRLQETAETLLDAALERRELAAQAMPSETTSSGGGAIVVMDVRTGALRVAAAGPRFEPGLFVAGDGRRLAAMLERNDHPLFDRVGRMAIAPGSVFKVLTAVALFSNEHFDPQAAYECKGYLRQQDRQRCAIFIRHGVGHGPVNLADALCMSCNTYFFHHGGQLGAEPLVDWATRFGFGEATGVDLPGEAAGRVPTPSTIAAIEGHAWRPGDTEAMAIGQGSLTVTPLQIARLLAAVANGGRLVTPHVVSGLGLTAHHETQDTKSQGSEDRDVEADDDPICIPPPRPISGLPDGVLAEVRTGLERVVSDPRGTGYGTVRLESVAIAGKTGTAQTGAGRLEHAWFAGYVPAEQPRYAVVVVLEHAGNASTAAGPVVKRLVMRMQQLGLLGRNTRMAAEKAYRE